MGRRPPRRRAPALHRQEQKLGPGTSRVEVVVENVGYLATHGLASAKKLALSEPISVEVGGGAARDEHKKVLGHLDGWGHGLYGGSPSWPYQATTAANTRQRASFVVDGDGPVTVRVGSCRVGFVDTIV